MHVFPKTRMSFPNPCVFLQKHAWLSRIHACCSRNPHVFPGATHVFPETRLSFPDPCLFFWKHACLSWIHACFSRNPHVFFGAMRVPPETRMLLRKHVCSAQNTPDKSLRHS